MTWLTKVLLICAVMIAYISAAAITEDRHRRAMEPEWEDLGWAWGKRSDPMMRPVRSLHKMKKNPEWHDLGWTWGKK